MKAVTLFTKGFVLEAEDGVITVLAGNHWSASVLGKAVMIADKHGIEILGEGSQFITFPSKLFSRLKSMPDSQKDLTTLTVTREKVVFTVRRRNTGYGQNAEINDADWAGWNVVLGTENISKKDGYYLIPTIDYVGLIRTTAEGMAEICDSALLLKATSYPIQIEGGKIKFSVENTEAGEWDRRDLTGTATFDEDYKENFADGIDAVFKKFLTGDIDIVIHKTSDADAMMITKTVAGKAEYVFLVASMPKDNKKKEEIVDEDDDFAEFDDPEDEYEEIEEEEE